MKSLDSYKLHVASSTGIECWLCGQKNKPEYLYACYDCAQGLRMGQFSNLTTDDLFYPVAMGEIAISTRVPIGTSSLATCVGIAAYSRGKAVLCHANASINLDVVKDKILAQFRDNDEISIGLVGGNKIAVGWIYDIFSKFVYEKRFKIVAAHLMDESPNTLGIDPLTGHFFANNISYQRFVNRDDILLKSFLASISCTDGASNDPNIIVVPDNL